MSAISVLQALRPLLVAALRTTCVNNHAKSTFVPVRHKTTKNQRKKAPHVAQDKGKWLKKATKQTVTETKDTRATETEAWLSRKPVDNVWIRTYYPRPRYSFEEALAMHREYAIPAMLDNAEGVVYADMELNMTTAKKTKFMKSVSSTLLLPHQFDDEAQKRFAVFCKKAEDIEKAKELKADYVGDIELVRQIQDGSLEPSDFEFALSTPDIFVELIPIRNILKGKFPNKGKGNLNSNIEEMIRYFRKGVSYESIKESDAVSKLQVPFGKLNMSDKQLLENLHTIIQSICKQRPEKLGPFIKKMFVIAPPSTEHFLLTVEDYVPGYKTKKFVETEEESDTDVDELRKEEAN
ncbi:39S ribosomal protein L1, mitochondrial-like [Gigantopelta aegis]|uniref:39S ribosomal protein L1, mitochondrial-like n=1 Tax=Gigantopelta aegis TaxID=1735272 RepID=UPI001B889908|nr:39S ribosomal protein L1, mitochondrial-like [Gigantopelta aegis]